MLSAASVTGPNLAEHFLDRNLEAGRGGRTAVVTDGGACTYMELADLVNRTGNALLQLGVRRQDRVLLALADGLEFVAAWFAAQKVGAVTAEVYTFLQPRDYAYYVDYTAASLVLGDARTLPRLREALARARHRPALLVAGADPAELRHGEIDLESLVARQPSLLDAAVPQPTDVAIWKFTTGSTGMPKACVHPARSALASYRSYAQGVLGITADDLVLPVPKLFFGYARDLAALFPFGAGAAGVVSAERSTPELIFELIARHRPSILVNVPTMMRAMLDHPGAEHQDLSCLRLCTSAGEALPEQLHRRWTRTFGVEVLDGLGSSEAYHIYISNRPGRVRPGSLGETVPGYRARVVDERGADVPDGEVGRLWVQGGSTALMYWEDEERSRQTFAGDVVMSGDLVERDRDGYFWYRGRGDDLLKIGAMWVAPAEVESCLASHPGVAECAVVGVQRDGLTRSCAFVALRSGARVSPEGLQSFVRERLAPHKAPREVRLTDRLPRTGSGKIDRRALRSAAAAPQGGIDT